MVIFPACDLPGIWESVVTDRLSFHYYENEAFLQVKSKGLYFSISASSVHIISFIGRFAGRLNRDAYWGVAVCGQKMATSYINV